MEDADDALERGAHVTNVEDDIDVSVHGLEQSDKLLRDAQPREPPPQQRANDSVESFDKVGAEDPS